MYWNFVHLVFALLAWARGDANARREKEVQVQFLINHLEWFKINESKQAELLALGTGFKMCYTCNHSHAKVENGVDVIQ